MTHNKREIDKSRLFGLLESISTYLDKEINFYALGGTALTLLDIKKSTLDIDINIERDKDYNYILELFSSLGFERNGQFRWTTQEGMAFDLFHGSYILGTDLLPDALNKSTFIKSFGLLKLFTLSLEDVIISKLARSDSRDLEDIRSILEHEKINLNNLASRYLETMKLSLIKDSKKKFLDLLQINCKKWRIIIDLKLINEVQKWDL